MGLIVAAFAATIAFHPALEARVAEARRIVVDIHKFKFVPENPVVSPGDVVVWQNRDIVPHTVTSKDESWDSGAIEDGGEWEVVITDDMTRDYFCRFHPAMAANLGRRGNR